MTQEDTNTEDLVEEEDVTTTEEEPETSFSTSRGIDSMVLLRCAVGHRAYYDNTTSPVYCKSAGCNRRVL